MRFSLPLLASLICITPSLAADLPAPSGAADIVSPDARLELLFPRTAKIQGGLTEGPAVAPDGSIYFTDIPVGADKGLIMRFDPSTKKTTVFSADSFKSNGLIFNRAGEFDFACLIAGHYQAGMVGKIKVVAAGKSDGHTTHKH